MERSMPRVSWSSIVAALAFVTASSPAVVRGQRPPDQRAILMEFYDATGGPQWRARTGWGTDAPVCDWEGVECWSSPDSQSVTSLALGENQLRGTLPASLASLPFLHTLDVSRNRLHGAVPAALIERADQNGLTLRIGGTSLDQALTSVTMRIDVDTGVCSGDADTRVVISPSRRQAEIEAVRCVPDGQADRPVACLRATIDAPDLDFLSRALQRLGLASMSTSFPRPGGGVIDHEVRYSATYAWGNGGTGSLAFRDDAGPLDALIAKRLLTDLIPPGWDRLATRVACDDFTWSR
jgi:hypothetical protein